MFLDKNWLATAKQNLFMDSHKKNYINMFMWCRQTLKGFFSYKTIFFWQSIRTFCDNPIQQTCWKHYLPEGKIWTKKAGGCGAQGTHTIPEKRNIIFEAIVIWRFAFDLLPDIRARDFNKNWQK